MFIQKLYRNGNSVAITIPKQFLEDLHLKEGEDVMIEKEGKKLVIVSKTTKLAPDVDSEFMKMVKEFADEHDDVLKDLANR